MTVFYIRISYELGYVNVREYAEGKQDWLDAGYPIEQGIPALV